MSTRPALAGLSSHFGSASLTRNRLFFWLFLLAASNGVAGMAIQWTYGHGWWRSLLDLFGVSAVVWVALVAALAILLESAQPAPVRRLDWWISALVAGIALLPIGPASAGALTFLSLYAIATSAKRSPVRRAAIILLAIAGTLLWGRLLLALLSRPLLTADGFLVATLFGAEQQGNILGFLDKSGSVAVAPGCSSLQGMSITIVFWALVNQWFKVAFSGRALVTLFVALLATIAINVVRIGLMLVFPEHFDMLHTGAGWHFFAWTTLIVVAAICLYGARREILAHS